MNVGHAWSRASGCLFFLLGMGLMASGLGCGEDNVGEIQNASPLASIDAQQQADLGAVITFDGTQSSDSDGQIMAWNWDFGDGATAQGETASHIFNAQGDFSIVLTVTDDSGATGQATLSLNVVENSAPTAVIVAPQSAQKGALFSLDGSLSSDPDGQVVDWSWSLGDGRLESGEQLDVSFADAGVFTLTLTVTDDRGAAATATQNIDVTEGLGDLSGAWSWTLVDESQRDLGGLCGSFQDSQLSIAATPPTLTITEEAGAISVDYSGTLDAGGNFDVTHDSLIGNQRIYGLFESSTRFVGKYAIDPGIGSCAERDVVGTHQ